MSVTSQLRSKRGPLWEFFEKNESTDGIKIITSKLKATSKPDRPNYNGSYKYSLTGTAFPYIAHTLLPKNKLRSSTRQGKRVYQEFNVERTLAFQFASHKYLEYWDYKILVDFMFNEAKNLISNTNEITCVAKGAIIFAILEVSARGGFLPKKLVQQYEKCGDEIKSVDTFLNNDITYDELVDDLIRLTKEFLKVNRPSENIFKDAKYFEFDKTLSHAAAVGGADIDVAILRNKKVSIIDYKTILKAIENTVTRQLLSYALLWDKNCDGEKMQLSSIGIYYTRLADLKEISIRDAFRIAFPKTCTLSKTRKSLIHSFSEFSDYYDLVNEKNSITQLRNILGR